MEQISEPLPKVKGSLLGVIKDLRKLDKAIVESYEKSYENEGNPMFAWATWIEARNRNIDCPKIVLSYMDEVANKLIEAAQLPEETLALDLKDALGFRSGRGYNSNLSDFRRFERNLQIAIMIFDQLNPKSGKKPTKTRAYEIAEKHFCLSISTVKRAFKSFENQLASS